MQIHPMARPPQNRTVVQCKKILSDIPQRFANLVRHFFIFFLHLFTHISIKQRMLVPSMSGQWVHGWGHVIANLANVAWSAEATSPTWDLLLDFLSEMHGYVTFQIMEMFTFSITKGTIKWASSFYVVVSCWWGFSWKVDNEKKIERFLKKCG